MRKVSCLLTAVLGIACMSGCAEQSTAAEMPEIVLLCKRVYNCGEAEDPELGRYSMTFWDKEGHYYATDDTALCELSFDALTERFREGDTRFTQLPQTCDTAALQEQFALVCDVVEDDACGLEYPEMLPDVEDDVVCWYGFYYDADNVLRYTLLHENTHMTPIYAYDDRLDAVYAWYQEAARTEG